MDLMHTIVGLLTFPGNLFRQLFAQVILRMYKCKIHGIQYFSLSRPCAEIRHEKIEGRWKLFFLCLIPFLLSFAAGVVIAVPMTLQVFHLGNAKLLNVIMFWLGFSLLCNMFPQYSDACALWKSFYGKGKANLFCKIIFAPVNALMFGGSWLMNNGLQFIFATVLTVFLPWIPLMIIK